jgi:hypothetical protein
MRCSIAKLTPGQVYRAFDCYDHAARAPTPLPCMSFGDETDEEVAKAWEQEGVGKTFASASEDKREGGVTVRSDDLVRGYANRERLLGKMEGVIIASRYVDSVHQPFSLERLWITVLTQEPERTTST